MIKSHILALGWPSNIECSPMKPASPESVTTNCSGLSHQRVPISVDDSPSPHFHSRLLKPTGSALASICESDRHTTKAAVSTASSAPLFFGDACSSAAYICAWSSVTTSATWAAGSARSTHVCPRVAVATSDCTDWTCLR